MDVASARQRAQATRVRGEVIELAEDDHGRGRCEPSDRFEQRVRALRRHHPARGEEHERARRRRPPASRRAAPSRSIGLSQSTPLGTYSTTRLPALTVFLAQGSRNARERRARAHEDALGQSEVEAADPRPLVAPIGRLVRGRDAGEAARQQRQQGRRVRLVQVDEVVTAAPQEIETADRIVDEHAEGAEWEPRKLDHLHTLDGGRGVLVRFAIDREVVAVAQPDQQILDHAAHASPRGEISGADESDPRPFAHGSSSTNSRQRFAKLSKP